MGVHEDQLTEQLLSELDDDCVILWIDDDDITLPDKTPASDSLPQLPHRDVIERNITTHIEKLRSLSTYAPPQLRLCHRRSRAPQAQVVRAHQL